MGLSACGWIEANGPLGGGPSNGYGGCDGCCCGARSFALGFRTVAEDAALVCGSWATLMPSTTCVLTKDQVLSQGSCANYFAVSRQTTGTVIKGYGEAYSTLQSSSDRSCGYPAIVVEDSADLQLADLTLSSGANNADSGAIRTDINAVLTVHRVVFRNHDGQMGGVFDEGSATFHSSTFYDNAATHVWARSTTTFYDCVFGAVST